MLIKPISHKLHSLYSYAIVQMSFNNFSKFDAAYTYMEGAYGDGIEHDREKLVNGYSRNNGDNSVWYYSTKIHSWRGHYYKIYLTTPEQLTMVSLVTGMS
jgi:hypothetical protein